MKKILFKKIPTWITVICISTSAFGFSFLGTGAGEEQLIPFLQQQISQLRKQVRTANETLGYIKGMQRGFSRIRKYGLNDAKNNFLLGNPDYLSVKDELYTLKEGGDYTEINIRDLDSKIRKIYKPKREKVSRESRRSLFASNIAHKNMKTSMIMGPKVSKQVHADGRRLSNASKNSLSPAESQRITADGVGLMVQTQADQLLMLSTLNQTASADLQIQATQEKKSIEETMIDQKTLSNSLQHTKAIR